jgi:hypothetical protein
LRRARSVKGRVIEWEFDNVDTRVHFENHIPEQFLFAVRDRAGAVRVTGWRFMDKDRMRLELERPLKGRATVTGAPTACPPSVLPFDICGYRPMLGFRVAVE